jgi:hypothetical protein
MEHSLSPHFCVGHRLELFQSAIAFRTGAPTELRVQLPRQNPGLYFRMHGQFIYCVAIAALFIGSLTDARATAGGR